MDDHPQIIMQPQEHVDVPVIAPGPNEEPIQVAPEPQVAPEAPPPQEEPVKDDLKLDSAPEPVEEEKPSADPVEAPEEKQEAVAEPPAEAPAAAPELPSDDAIVARLKEVLKTVDLSVTTEKMLRRTLEAEFKVDLSSKKAVIRSEVTAYLEAQAPAAQDEAQEEEESEEEEEEGPSRKRSRGGASRFGDVLSEPMSKFLNMERCPRTQVVKKMWEYIKEHNLQDPKDRRRILLDDKLKTIFPGKSVTMFTMQKHLSKHVFIAEDSEEEEEDYSSDEEGSEEEAPAKKQKKAAPAKKAPAKKPAAKKSTSSRRGSTDGPAKPNGFTKPLKLAPDLAAWMGSETASRPEITKKLWAYIKENNLQDPSNKQYAISDDTLRGLTGEDRFLAFGFGKLIKDKILGYAD